MSDFPRLLYRGAPDETAETQAVENEEALARALEEGWRRQRRIEPPAEVAEAPDADEATPLPSGARRRRS
jgi:hypothetical protein